MQSLRGKSPTTTQRWGYALLALIAAAAPALAIAPGRRPPGTPAPSDLLLTVTNKGDYQGQIYTWFQQPITATFDGTTNAVSTATSYSLATLGTGIDIDTFIGGRIFITLDAPFPAQTTAANAPEFNLLLPPNNVNAVAANNSYNNRHQLIGEITLTPATGDTANLSQIDWVSMAAAMQTYDSLGNKLQRIGFPENVDTSAYFTALANLTNGQAVVSSLTNIAGNDPTYSSQTGVTGTTSQAPSAGSAVRILSPTSNYQLGEAGLTQYQSFANYIDHLQAVHAQDPSKPIATLEGKFFAGDAPTYKFTVNNIVDAPANFPWSLGRVEMSGTISTDPTTTHNIVIPFASFSDTTIYGGYTGKPANMTNGNKELGIGYGLDGVLQDGGANDVFTLPVRDFIAGLNYGYIGSTVTNPNDPSGKTYGESSSQYWGTLNLITLANQTFNAFDQVQPSNTYYNQWAQVVHQYSGGKAYGFAYDDVFAPVSIGVDVYNNTPVARLDIEILSVPAFPATSGLAALIALKQRQGFLTLEDVMRIYPQIFGENFIPNTSSDPMPPISGFIGNITFAGSFPQASVAVPEVSAQALLANVAILALGWMLVQGQRRARHQAA